MNCSRDFDPFSGQKVTADDGVTDFGVGEQRTDFDADPLAARADDGRAEMSRHTLPFVIEQ